MTRFSYLNSRNKEYKEVMGKEYSVKQYTPESCVKALLNLVPIDDTDICLDPASGENKVWFNNFPTKNKIELELDEGKDFLKFNDRVDWVLGNPPYNLFIKYLFHSADISNKGFGFLINHSRLNQVTPKRLDDLRKKGFYLSRIHIMNIKSWFGRYYFLLFTPYPTDGIGFTRETFK